MALKDDIHVTSTPGFVSASIRHSRIRASVAEANEIRPGFWWVCRVLVDPKVRGEGVGKALVGAMKAACIEQGAEVVQVAPGGYDLDTARQRGFYAACGFTPKRGDPEGPMYWRPEGRA
jgi:GNAT superfamily N-acetyltransferase